jgi:hypothetical protein
MRRQRGVNRHGRQHKVVKVHRRQINASTLRATGLGTSLAVTYRSEVDANSSRDNFENPSKRQKVTRLAWSHCSHTSVSSPRMYRPRPNVQADAGVLQRGHDNSRFRISQRAIRSCNKPNVAIQKVRYSIKLRDSNYAILAELGTGRKYKL